MKIKPQGKLLLLCRHPFHNADGQKDSRASDFDGLLTMGLFRCVLTRYAEHFAVLKARQAWKNTMTDVGQYFADRILTTVRKPGIGKSDSAVENDACHAMRVRSVLRLEFRAGGEQLGSVTDRYFHFTQEHLCRSLFPAGAQWNWTNAERTHSERAAGNLATPSAKQQTLL